MGRDSAHDERADSGNIPPVSTPRGRTAQPIGIFSSVPALGLGVCLWEYDCLAGGFVCPGVGAGGWDRDRERERGVPAEGDEEGRDDGGKGSGGRSWDGCDGVGDGAGGGAWDGVVVEGGGEGYGAGEGGVEGGGAEEG